MRIVQKIALVFTILGALNWGLIGLFDFNLVTSIFGDATFWTKAVYTIIGVAGIINIMILFLDFKD